MASVRKATRQAHCFVDGMRGRRVDDNVETRIGRDIEPQPSGCWLWKGRADAYGHTSGPGTETTYIHRFVYETLVGPIEDGHHLHHECLTPGCCNPAHLVPLTPQEHADRHAAMRAH